ncbi:hypothetical protein [Aurantiacibacter gilvus]|uniref:DUF2169 domain-containing protein n=1 Tax=Aurantiacibacter gilvus TaxID=3139141 RepID=A0ABU9IEX9_9SPHN
MTEEPIIAGDEAPRRHAIDGNWTVIDRCAPEENRVCNEPLPLGRVEGDQLFEFEPGGTPNEPVSDIEQTHHYVLLQGAPLIAQVETSLIDPDQRLASSFHTYFALDPIEWSDDGQLVAARIWPILCGPPPQPGEWNHDIDSPARHMTNFPYPGMGEDCLPKDVETLRNAARESRQYSEDIELRWAGK